VRADPRITLIVTTYNWPAALDLTLRSVARQSMRPDEVIVADDGSGARHGVGSISRSCPTINPL
jgi:GT2 family glycosyltransferase